MMVILKRISTALGLLAATASATAMGQHVAPSVNQTTADAVARALRVSDGLSASRIAIEAREGVITLSGVVLSDELKAEALGRAQQVAGVASVVDRLVVGDPRVQPARYSMNSGVPAQLALGHGNQGGIMSEPMIMDGSGPIMMGSTGATATDGPMPEGPAGMAGGTQAAMPGYPNYAWPSYAPYPNFSAVGYPTAYPWQAWPNIGPFYPYPEVPLDWRAVTLRWDDGIWWLDFRKHYTRPFFIPYPFGLFAY